MESQNSEAASPERLAQEKPMEAQLVLRPDGVICSANSAAAELFGRVREDLVGTPFGFPAFAGQVSEIYLIRRGEPVLAEARISAARAEGQEVLLVSLRDVTGQMRLLRERARYSEQLEQLTAATLEVNTARSMAEVARIAARRVLALLNAEAGVAVVRDEGDQGWMAEAWPAEHLPGAPAVEMAEAMAPPECLESLRHGGAVGTTAEVRQGQAEIRTVLAGPRGWPLGLLRAHRAGPPFSNTERRLLEQLGNGVAAALGNLALVGQLRTSERKFRALFEHASDATFIYHGDVVAECNQAAEAMFRRPAYELAGLRPEDLSPERQPNGELSSDAIRRHSEDCARLGPQVFEFRHRRADGEEFDTDVSLRLADLDGQHVAVVGVREITERKEAQRRLEASQAHLARAHKMALLGSWETDLRSGASSCSDELLGILGLPPGSVAPGLEERLRLVLPEDTARVRSAREAALAAGKPYDIEYRLLRPDGTEVAVREHGEPVLDAEGRPAGLAGTTQDVTAFKRLEEQFLQAQKLESVGRLAGGVAHDFNNLLTVINGYSDLALRSVDPRDPLHAQISEIGRAGERAARLTQQLLAFSRRQVFRPEVVDLSLIVNDVEKMLRRLVGEDVELFTALDPALGRVLADAGQIQQVLMNLAVNARDAMPVGGRLLIETRNVELDEEYQASHPEVTPGQYVMLAVSDTGVGMDEKTRRLIFEPFFTTKPMGEGTGLGLSTVYGIVRQSNGWIWVYSELGKGTTFKIYLPRVDRPVAPGRSAAGPDLAPRGAETILLVEDQPEVRTLAATVMRRLGYQVIEASSAEEALGVAELHGDRIQLLLSDVVMPGINGRELARRLRASLPRLKVLFMSGFAESLTIQEQALERGDGFISKPMSPAALARKVREILGGDPARGTVLLVEKDPAVRRMVSQVLGGDGFRVIETGDAAAAAIAAQSCRPDLLIAGAAADPDGAGAFRAVRQIHPGVRAIALSDALAGADEDVLVVEQPVQPARLLEAVRSLLA